jgi:hypothetical protein
MAAPLDDWPESQSAKLDGRPRTPKDSRNIRRPRRNNRKTIRKPFDGIHRRGGKSIF